MDVWLRGNVRPVVGIGTVVVVGLVAAAVVAAVAGAGVAAVATLAAAAGAAAVAVALLAGAAAGMRLGRRGSVLLLRLAPWRTEAVPLGIVECVFPGSQPLDGDGAGGDSAAEPPPTRRVGTLVIRFAERAAEWRERPTFAAWGSWRDGHAIVDGRWCEPLTADVSRAIGQRLLEAKREAAAESAR